MDNFGIVIFSKDQITEHAYIEIERALDLKYKYKLAGTAFMNNWGKFEDFP